MFRNLSGDYFGNLDRMIYSLCMNEQAVICRYIFFVTLETVQFFTFIQKASSTIQRYNRPEITLAFPFTLLSQAGSLHYINTTPPAARASLWSLFHLKLLVQQLFW